MTIDTKNFTVKYKIYNENYQNMLKTNFCLNKCWDPKNVKYLQIGFTLVVKAD